MKSAHNGKKPAHLDRFFEYYYPERSLLDLSHIPLSHTDVQELIEFLACHPNIKSLNLVNCSIDDTSAALLAKTKLVCLNLGNNNIGSDGAIALAANSTLKVLKLFNNTIMSAGALELANNTTLQALDLSGNSIGKNATEALFNNTNLKALEINYTRANNQAIKQGVSTNNTLDVLKIYGGHTLDVQIGDNSEMITSLEANKNMIHATLPNSTINQQLSLDTISTTNLNRKISESELILQVITLLQCVRQPNNISGQKNPLHDLPRDIIFYILLYVANEIRSKNSLLEMFNLAYMNLSPENQKPVLFKWDHTVLVIVDNTTQQKNIFKSKFLPARDQDQIDRSLSKISYYDFWISTPNDILYGKRFHFNNYINAHYDNTLYKRIFQNDHYAGLHFIQGPRRYKKSDNVEIEKNDKIVPNNNRKRKLESNNEISTRNNKSQKTNEKLYANQMFFEKQNNIKNTTFQFMGTFCNGTITQNYHLAEYLIDLPASLNLDSVYLFIKQRIADNQLQNIITFKIIDGARKLEISLNTSTHKNLSIIGIDETNEEVMNLLSSP